ncbi:uncharacterized protein LOC106175442 [Lingula anatina]|uniref:Uncharacterized protein LOC106175442 n=1 Tax=Lingula anatina TaxID=7574 RepID=A0A1S3JS19_LINAN|nr:uncharacterized protein LOC106175442 [Lingula anatina]XP_013412902.1 uncharacterized protein LOC106175442 [Lingula anatina]|eukprot:XP_013412901.1 uncharacterized protein LOC106175442 [Lingula anatina]
MWTYFWAHSMYHLTRWFPQNNRAKIRIIILIFSAGVLFPQFFVMTRDHSGRYCGQNLLEFLIATIVFTLMMIGFTFIFTIMEPVPREVKLAFHVFGIVTFVFGCISTILTSLAGDCSQTTEELYYFSLAMAIASMCAIAFFAVMVPFWLINWRWKKSVLDVQNRTGLCYEPVNCCQCLWHI